MSKITRRRFVQGTAAATAFSTFTISGTKSSGRVIGANDTIRIGVAGIKSRGGAHIDAYRRMKNVDITYLIDPDSGLFDSRKKQADGKAKCVQDYRQALEDKDLDVVSIASTNSTHSLITVAACQAGKDVYVEKPLSHNVFEGRKCVEAARKYKRVVQHGTQQRSSSGRAAEIAAVQSGKYGKLLVSKGYCCKPRWSIGFKKEEAPPKELDFNLWLGPAPQQPYHRNIVHYNWHWFWDFGCGDTGNQGVHEMDVARWAIKDSTLPNKIYSLGGRFAPGEKNFKDQGQTPNQQLTVYEFGDVLLVFETRGLVGKDKKFPIMVHNEFYTSEGMIKGGTFYPHNGGKKEKVSGGTPDKITGGGPFGSFITAVRSRKPEDNNADVAVGHYSSALCHLGNISFKLGGPLPFNKKAQSLGDNKQVVESFEKLKANCGNVGVNLDEATYTVGRVLNFNPKTEKFIDDSEADGLLTRNYRKPFVVPDVV